MNLAKRLVPVVIIFPAILAIGGIGYRTIESWAWSDSIYMAIITVFTVGFSEVHPLSLEGRLFTAFLILLGVGGLTYTFGTVSNYVIAGELRGFLRERRMKRIIDSLSGHFVICGYGEMGRQVCRELYRQGCSLVVLDISLQAVQQAREQGYLAVQGDAGLDSALKECGIERAEGLVVATDDDSTNLLVVLSARGIRSDLAIVARANLEEVIEKLRRAGANRVLFAQMVAGRRMAQMLLNPEICDFVDVVTHDESLELLLENFSLCRGSGLENKTLRDSRIRELTGASVVGLKREGVGIIPSLTPSTMLLADDIVFALGTREQLNKLAARLRAGRF
jgi:voltage-gated potassium channel